MNIDQIIIYIVALILGMMVANMLTDVCGCKDIVEGQGELGCPDVNCQDFLGWQDGPARVIKDSTKTETVKIGEEAKCCKLEREEVAPSTGKWSGARPEASLLQCLDQFNESAFGDDSPVGWLEPGRRSDLSDSWCNEDRSTHLERGIRNNVASGKRLWRNFTSNELEKFNDWVRDPAECAVQPAQSQHEGTCAKKGTASGMTRADRRDECTAYSVTGLGAAPVHPCKWLDGGGWTEMPDDYRVYCGIYEGGDAAGKCLKTQLCDEGNIWDEEMKSCIAGPGPAPTPPLPGYGDNGRLCDAIVEDRRFSTDFGRSKLDSTANCPATACFNNLVDVQHLTSRQVLKYDKGNTQCKTAYMPTLIDAASQDHNQFQWFASANSCLAGGGCPCSKNCLSLYEKINDAPTLIQQLQGTDWDNPWEASIASGTAAAGGGK